MQAYARKIIEICLVSFMLLLGGFSHAQSRDKYEAIDSYARNCPKAATKTVATLANYLQQCCKTDMEKARVIYVWIAENIRYDDGAYNSGSYSNSNADNVLISRNSVCEGFSNLFLDLGLKMNLNIRKVSGYAKGYSYVSGVQPSEPNHAWNTIKINGVWRLFDVTWGQGYGYTNKKGEMSSIKEFDDFWFDTDPYAFIFSHYPEDVNYMLIDTTIKIADFWKLPRLYKSDFKHSISAKKIFEFATKHPEMKFPTFCTYSPENFKIVHIPMSNELHKGKRYHFEFIFQGGRNILLRDSLHTYTFKKNSGVFSLNFIPVYSGRISIETEEIKDHWMQQGYMWYIVQ